MTDPMSVGGALAPSDHAEAVALARAEIIGALARREHFAHGELRAELERLCTQRWRMPDADATRTFGRSTLERWLYDFRRGGLAALRPRPRADRGRARALPAATRTLLLDIRREHPATSVPLILRTLCDDGRLAAGVVSPTTVRRLYREQGLDRVAARTTGHSDKTRLRWQCSEPNVLWHGDVCHGASIWLGDVARPLRIHAFLDDHSRYVLALEAHHAEREQDMLGLLVSALRRHGAPSALYLDNGSTYRGEVLRTACGRLGITLLHAAPYDAPARGKMERFWRTLREGCLDHLGRQTSLEAVQRHLDAFLAEHYHRAPHAALLGKSPAQVWAHSPRPIDEARLREALTVRSTRRIRRDSTLSLDGVTWELDQRYLAGRTVTVSHCVVDASDVPVVEHEGRRYVLHRVDPEANARRKRPRRTQAAGDAPRTPVDFAPNDARLARAATRARREQP